MIQHAHRSMTQLEVLIHNFVRHSKNDTKTLKIAVDLATEEMRRDATVIVIKSIEHRLAAFKEQIQARTAEELDSTDLSEM